MELRDSAIYLRVCIRVKAFRLGAIGQKETPRARPFLKQIECEPQQSCGLDETCAPSSGAKDPIENRRPADQAYEID